MGVVRREGDWRLEKQEEGVYEITHRRRPQVKVLTPDYTPGMVDEHSMAAVPVREVGSYEEAKGLFEEHAEGRQSTGLGPPSMEPTSLGSVDGGRDLDFSLGNEGEDVDLPPGGIALVLLLTGGIFVYSSDFAVGSLVFSIGILVGIGGVLILAFAGVIYKTKGAAEAIDFLVSSDSSDTNDVSGGSDDEQERTPPAPQKLKDDLYFDRANQSCEWCGDQLDHPEIHHIEPRSEGGPNEPDNLIVLCPNCHRKADRGGLTKTKLKAKVRRIMDS